MGKKAPRLLKSKGISVPKLLELIPSSLLARLAAEVSVDKWIKKLPAEAVFKLVLFSLLDSERISLRVMEATTRDPFFRRIYPALSANEVTWVGIRQRLMQLNPSYCRALYETVYAQAQTLYGEADLGKYHIKRYDSTMIATFAHLLEGIRVGNSKQGKRQVKLTTTLLDGFLLKMRIHTDQAYLGDDVALKEAILQDTHGADEIVVFDRGLKGRHTFAQFDEAGIRFVSRLNANARYKELQRHEVAEESPAQEDIELLQDSVVYLYGEGRTLVQHKLRRIQYRIEGHNYVFVTNIWDQPASVIARVYRARWDIEVLFRFMKQEMNLTHFVCNDRNAIEVMLYFTLIAAMLVLIYKKHNGIRSYKMAKIQFFKELVYSVVLEIIESPEGIEHFKHNLEAYVRTG